MKSKIYLKCLCGLLLAFMCVYMSGYAFPQRGVRRDTDAEVKIAPVLYLALGDSTGVGVGAQRGGGYVQRLFTRIQHTRKDSRLVNLCASAASTADVLSQQASQVSDTNPTLVTLGVGANDLIRGLTVEQFAADYEKLVMRLMENKRASIILMNIPDISLAPAVPAYMRDAARRHIVIFNQRIEGIAKRHNLTLIDLYGRSSDFKLHPEFFAADGFHPSDAGYEFWTELMWPDVEKVINK